MATTQNSNIQNSQPQPGVAPNPVEENKNSYFGAVFDTHVQGELVVESISSKTLVGIYFSGSWCPPCKTFLPVLIDFYKEINFDEPQFEIFFASCDTDDAQYKAFFEKMPWKAFPYNDERINRFKALYGVTGIPKLIVLTPDGLLVTKEGRIDILKKGENAWLDWLKGKEEAIERQKNAPPPQPATLANSNVQGLQASSMIDGLKESKRI